MSEHYNQNYTRYDIDDILYKIKSCVKEGTYTLALNDKRAENRSFIEEYNISSTRLRAILLGIETDDFCHSLNNLNPKFPDEVLYVFAPILNLYDISGKQEELAVYIKFNLIEKSSSDLLIIISFHKLNREVQYLFK